MVILLFTKILNKIVNIITIALLNQLFFYSHNERTVVHSLNIIDNDAIYLKNG